MENLLDTDKRPLFLFIVILMFCSCHSIKNYDYKLIECQKIPKEAVNIAIADYSKQLKRRKDLSHVVAVNVYVHFTTTDWFFISMIPWIDESDKFPIEYLDMYMGKIPPSHIPTEYVQWNNVLFVWHNPQHVLTEDIKRVLVNNKLVLYPGEDWVLTLDGTCLSYIFCKTNYKRRYYKKVTATYKTPLPSCGCH